MNGKRWIAGFLILCLALIIRAQLANAGQRYALVRPDNTIERFADDIDPKAGTKPGWRWLPAPIASAPTHDPETQVLEGPTRIVGATSVTENYTVRARTTAELDAVRDEKLDGIAEAVLRVLCNHENRLRTLKTPPDQSVTQAQCRTAIRGMLP
jgi:hypothetical protein